MTSSEGGPIDVGDRVRLSGGYDMEPNWLSGKEAIEGVVERLGPGQNRQPCLVVKLDEPLTAGGVTGDRVVLELRYRGAEWRDGEVVHIELCDFDPAAKPWKDRPQGAWIESHATLRTA